MGSLDASCTLDTSISTTVIGGVTLKDDYNANTNSPDLDSSPISCIKKGDQYVISVAGTFFTEAVQAGDSIISKQDCPTLLTHWIRVENNLIADPFARANHSGSQAASTISDFDTEVGNNSTVSTNTAKISYCSTDSTKLSGIETSATANSSDSTLKCRSNHTGSQASCTITGLATSATTDTTSASNIGSGTLPLARLSGITNTELSGSAGIAISKISGFDTQVKTIRLDEMAAPTADVDLNAQNITGVNYQDLDNISSPGNPSAGKGRLFIKTLDGNNDAIFILVKKNGSFQEVQIA
jgi:hypothetical protein